MKLHQLLILLLFLNSCFKKEKPLSLPKGSSTINSLFLGDNYENQIFFDLGTNTFQQKDLVQWDLRFQSGENETGIFLNNGNDIKIRKTNLYNLDEPLTTDTNYIKELPELIDAPEGDADNSAIGKWYNYVSPGVSKPGIYVLELFYKQGWDRFVRMQILESNDSEYVCKFSPLYKNGKKVTEWNELTNIKKDKNQNYTYYSFKNGGNIIDLAEPNKNTWDIEFTKYKHIFYNYGPTPFPYTVTGVLSNPNQVEIAIDSSSVFNEIDLTKISNYNFSKKRNAIGFEWKSFDFSSSFVYSVNSKYTYIIKDTEGNYYKFKFLDFYNEQRVKGYPKFEFLRIK